MPAPAPRPPLDRPAAQEAGALTPFALHRVEIWLPDTDSDAFRREAAEQSRRIAAAEDEDDVMRFIESVIDLDDDG